MTQFIAVFIVFALAITGMAIGVIFHRKGIQGSCGGLANFKDADGNSMCEACTTPSPECVTRLEENFEPRRHEDTK